MDLNPHTIELIVQRVIERLGDGAAQRADAESAAADPSVRIDQRIVSAQLLSATPGRACISIPHDAIVTPAARDMIRDRRLSVHRRSGDASARANPVEHFVFSEDRTHLQRLRSQAVRDAVAVSGIDQLKQLIAATLSRGHAAIVLTESCFAVAGNLNRDEKVRAVAVETTEQSRRAGRQFRANVMVIESTSVAPSALSSLLEHRRNPERSTHP